MAYNVSINGIDRTGDVINQSIVIEDIINDQVNTCNLTLTDLSGNGIPSTDDEIIITLSDATIIFGGFILSTVVSTKGTGAAYAQIHCVDYTRLFDRNLVHKSYEDATDLEIIEDIVATYCGGFGITTDNVIEGITLSQISFNYVQPSQALRRLCDLTGRNWFIDYEKDIHYFPLTTDAAPFNIATGGSNFNRLSISKDSSQLKNRVYVRGGTKLSDSTTYEEKGDGKKKVFVLPDHPHDVTVAVNGVSKTLGIKNIDLTGFDYYLNFQEKYVEQDVGGVVLGTGDTLTVVYKYDIPILVAQENTASIAESGVEEFAIFDKTITTTDAARDRATAELTDYANAIVEGGFSTFTNGFKSGQYITINHSTYGINADYIIQKVRAESIGSGNFEYEIKIASVKTMGIIRFLIELLEANRNLIELDDDEVVDELFMLSDSLFADSLTEALTIDSAGPYRTWASDSLEATVTVAKWNLFQWG